MALWESPVGIVREYFSLSCLPCFLLCFVIQNEKEVKKEMFHAFCLIFFFLIWSNQLQKAKGEGFAPVKPV